MMICFLLTVLTFHVSLPFHMPLPAFHRPSPSHSITSLCSSPPTTIPDLDLSVLGNNHVTEANLLSATIGRHLNDSYIPQRSHYLIAQTVAALYVTARERDNKAGVVTAVTDIMIEIAEKLEKVGGMDQTGIFEGAFINNWDVGNLVSDYFVARIGVEGEPHMCECRHV